jgi:hypothetical protein
MSEMRGDTTDMINATVVDAADDDASWNFNTTYKFHRRNIWHIALVASMASAMASQTMSLEFASVGVRISRAVLLSLKAQNIHGANETNMIGATIGSELLSAKGISAIAESAKTISLDSLIPAILNVLLMSNPSKFVTTVATS